VERFVAALGVCVLLTSASGAASSAFASGRICGYVYFCEDNAPVDGVQIVFTGPSPATTQYISYTDASGHYCSPTINNGSYKVIAYSPNWDTDVGYPSVIVNNGDHVSVNFHMKTATTSGSVRDSCNNAPLGSVTVRLVGPTTYVTTTNVISGIFQFQHVRQGDYWLYIDPLPNWIVPPSENQASFQHIGSLGCVIDGPHNRRLLAYRRITGQVVSYENNQPLANIAVYWGIECGGASGHTLTDASGHYDTGLLPPDWYSVWAGNCADLTYACRFSDPIKTTCSDQVANFKEKGMVAISGLTVTHHPNDMGLTVNWSGGDASTGGYRLYRSESSSGPFNRLADTDPPFLDASADCGQSYYYEVAPLTECGEEIEGNRCASVGATNTCPPDPPNSIQVAPTGYSRDNQFTISWLPPSVSFATITGYYYRVNGGTVQFVGGSSVSGALASLTGSNVFEVYAVDAAGNSSDWASTRFYYDPHFVPAPLLSSPANGAAVALPEVFAWGAVPGAAAYDIQVAADDAFTNLIWSSTTSLTSVSVPAVLSLSNGAPFYWRIRATDSGFTGAWSQTWSCERVSAVAPPSQVSLASPADGATQPLNSLLFEWTAVTSATSYRLEISTSNTFLDGTASTWVLDKIPGTSTAVTLQPGLQQVYWRVTASNSAGGGPVSATRSIINGSLAGQVSGASITLPDRDITLYQDSTLSVSGLAVAAASGSATAEWLLDGGVFATEQLQFGGSGQDLSDQQTPYLPFGIHQLALRVTAGNTVQAIPRTITVIQPDWGTPSALEVVPNQPDLLPNDSTIVYCTIRDAAGNIIGSQSGTAVYFSTDVPGASFNPPSATILNGTATTTFFSPTAAALGNIYASTEPAQAARFRGLAAAGGLTGQADVSVNADALSQAKAQVTRYLKALDKLNLVGISGVDKDLVTLNPVNTTSAWQHVTSAGPGDLYRLKRLYLFLRGADWLFRPLQPSAPDALQPTEGVALLFTNFASAQTNTELARWYLLYDPDIVYTMLCSGVPFGCTALTFSKHKLEDWARDKMDSYFNGSLTSPKRPVSKPRQSILRKWRDEARWSLQAAAQSGELNAAALVQGIADPGYRLRLNRTTSLACEFLNSSYIYPLNNDLPRVVSTLWNYNGDLSTGFGTALQNQITITTAAVIRARTLAGIYTTAQGAYQNWVGALFSKVPIASSVKSMWEALVIQDAGVSCSNAAFDLVANLDLFERFAEGPAHVTMTAAGSSVHFASGPSRSIKLTASRGFQAAKNLTEGAASDFENLLRTAEVAVETGDTAAVRSAVGTIETLGNSVGRGQAALLASLSSTFEDGRLSVVDFSDSVSALSTSYQAGQDARVTLSGILPSWVSSPDTAMTTNALAAIRGANDASNLARVRLETYLANALGITSQSFLVPSVDAPSEGVGWEDTCVVTVTVTNWGGVPSDPDTVAISTLAEQLTVLDPPSLALPSIEPGGSAEATWRCVPIQQPLAQDSTLTVPFDVQLQSGSNTSIMAGGTLLVTWNPNLTDVELDHRGPPNLRVVENPARGVIRLRLQLPRITPAEVGVIDVSGRKVWSSGWRTYPAGSYDLTVPGHLAPGVYFARARGIGMAAAQRLVILR
jgi:hypothetical protein